MKYCEHHGVYLSGAGGCPTCKEEGIETATPDNVEQLNATIAEQTKRIEELEGDLRHKTLQWEGVKDMLAHKSSELTTLRAELAEARAGFIPMKVEMVANVSGWLHEWLYLKKGRDKKALEDAIRHIDDEMAGLLAWKRRRDNAADEAGKGE
jgi:chromosome segregation ATPase